MRPRTGCRGSGGQVLTDLRCGAATGSSEEVRVGRGLIGWGLGPGHVGDWAVDRVKAGGGSLRFPRLGRVSSVAGGPAV